VIGPSKHQFRIRRLRRRQNAALRASRSRPAVRRRRGVALMQAWLVYPAPFPSFAPSGEGPADEADGTEPCPGDARHQFHEHLEAPIPPWWPAWTLPCGDVGAPGWDPGADRHALRIPRGSGRDTRRVRASHGPSSTLAPICGSTSNRMRPSTCRGLFHWLQERLAVSAIRPGRYTSSPASVRGTPTDRGAMVAGRSVPPRTSTNPRIPSTTSRSTRWRVRRSGAPWGASYVMASAWRSNGRGLQLSHRASRTWWGTTRT